MIQNITKKIIDHKSSLKPYIMNNIDISKFMQLKHKSNYWQLNF